MLGKIPKEHVLELAKTTGAKAFVETGTHLGATAKWARLHFPVVHTIELCPNRFHEIPSVNTHLGNSRDILPEILSSLDDGVFWLDGHFPGGGKEDQCPILDEIAALADRTNDIILIDDFRLFATLPPEPLNPNQWPTVLSICNTISKWKLPRFVQIMDDVIYILPPSLRFYFLNIRNRDQRK